MYAIPSTAEWKYAGETDGDVDRNDNFGVVNKKNVISTVAKNVMFYVHIYFLFVVDVN